MLRSIFSGQQLQQYLAKNDAVGLFAYNTRLKICEWNHYMELVAGIDRRSCIDRSVFSVIPTYHRKEDEPNLKKALQGECFMIKGKPMVVNQLSGETHYFNFLYVPLCNHEGIKVDRVMVMALETSAHQKKARASQTITMRTLKSFLQFAPMPVYIIDNKFKIKMASESFNWYIKQERSVGKKLEELFPSVTASQLQQQVSRVMEHGKVEFFNETFRVKKQQYHFFTIRFPIRNERGKIEAVGGYSLDISGRVKQEQKIQALLGESNELNEKLEDQNMELRQNRQHLEQSNRQLLEQKQELERTLKELSDRNYELDQIMYKTSHDLRSPLTSILGLLSLAKAERDLEKLPEYHHYIEDRVYKLDNFVKSMLSYAKTSRAEIVPEEVNWKAILEESLNHLDYLPNYNKIEISQEFDLNGKPFKSDLMSLKVIFNNLVGNAIKYADLNKENPFIKIKVDAKDWQVLITIEDNGIGIGSQYLDKIGKMFFRATETSEGSGLGIYIVKQAVEKLGGELKMESISREGTKISIHLKSFNGMSLAEG